jgi:hypothetical protein
MEISQRFFRRLFAPVFGAMLCLLVASAPARNGDEGLNYYGLLTLSDKAAGARLASRFKAKGQPVFLVHDLNAGLGQNDIMRFVDKAVLIDGPVWATLQAEGALEKLMAAPVVRVQGRANSASWEQRSNLVAGDRQRKAFKLGTELLRTVEQNFADASLNGQLTVLFEQGHLTLLAPTELLDQLRFLPVRRVAPLGRPRIVSVAPPGDLFSGQPFDYQVWGVDPTDPTGSLTYQMLGELPPGLRWSDSAHALRGKPAAPGRWKLTAQVRNADGIRDTLSFYLRVRVNQPPVLSGIPQPLIQAQREWRFDPLPSDADHPGYAIRVNPGPLPKGMFFHPDSFYVRWTPDSSLAGTRQSFTLTAEDALGAKRDFRYTVQIVARQGIPLSNDITIELPWDSLVQGRQYVWKARTQKTAWAAQGILLRNIEGSDSTVFKGDSLRLRPMAVGIHRLDFTFLAQGAPVTQSMSIHVRRDLPPEFVTELGEWRLGDQNRSTSLKYRPTAVDPEGEPVTLSAEIPAGSPLEWDGTRIHFKPEAPGLYPAAFTARDGGKNTAEQWVAFRSEPKSASAYWILETRTFRQYSTVSVTRDFGTGRIGFYSPNFNRDFVPNRHWAFRETPYVFLGGNLLGRENEAEGRTLWSDFGVGFRNPAPRIITGGVYMRLNGEWHFSNSPLSWVEMEVTTHIHQAMMATDSGMLLTLFRDTTDIINRDSLSQNGILSRIIRDGFREDNIVVASRLEALGALGYGFYVGPSLWREDFPIRQRYEQRLGAALRFRKVFGNDIYQLTVRGGWSPGGDGWGGFATLRMAFGSL